MLSAPSSSERGEGVGSSLWHLLPDVDAHREFLWAAIKLYHGERTAGLDG